MKKSFMYISIFILHAILVFYGCGLDGDNDKDSSAETPLFHTPASLYEDLNRINKRYPAITKIETIGTSVEGREIYAFIVSDNPEKNEQEPKLRFTASIHGDENVSTELLYNMITYITDNYENDTRISTIVNDRYMVFIPMMNPDGVANNSRYNASGVDLNRNFEFKWISSVTHGITYFSEPESRAVRDYSLARVFHLSATYHSGATVVNIPYDYASESNGIVPVEYSLIKQVAKIYSTSGAFLSNPDVMDYSFVDQGVVNGGDWYVVNGSMQDWSLVGTGCIDLTIEISNKKNGHTQEEIASIYGYNREAMLAYIEAAGRGISGAVVNNQGGAVANAKIFIAGGDIITPTDSDGFFHKILLAGSYTLHVEADGYQPYSQQVAVSNGTVSEKITVVLQSL